MAMSRRPVRSGLVLGLAALAGASAALAYAELTTTEATTDTSQPPGRSTPSTRPPSKKERDNRILLSHRESLRLVAWAMAFRRCLAKRGVEVGKPVAHAKQIDLELLAPGSPEELAPKTTGCGDSLGEPPRRSSLQFRPGKLVLYLPKQCLLDPKVTADA